MSDDPLYIAFSIAFYLIPTGIALLRRHHNRLVIAAARHGPSSVGSCACSGP